MKKNYTSSWSSWKQVNQLKMIVSMVVFLSLGLSFNSNAQLFNVAGNCTMNVAGNLYGPMYSTANPAATSRTATIYPASQLVGISGQELTSIYFNRIGVVPDPTGGTPNFKVYLKETSSTDFGAAALDWATVVSGATLVYDSNPLTAIQGGLGWKQIVFSNNFTYSGTNNLILLMEYVNTGNTTNIQWQYEYIGPCVNTTNSTTTKYINNTTGVLGTSLSSENYRRPQIAFDYTVLCPAPVSISTSAITTTGVTANWTAGGTETSWDYAFQPQGGGVPTTFLQTSTPTVTVNNLSSATVYDFFVRANCGGTNGASIWKGPYTFSTNCAPITSLPWAEDFDNMAVLGLNVLPFCWVNENPGFWTTTTLPLSTTTAGPNSGPNYLRVRYNSTSTVWTPEFDLVAGQTYEFSFNWAGDGKAGWDGAVYVNNSATIIGATMLGANFVEVADVTTFDYQEEIFCFTPATSGLYTFGTKVVVPTSLQNYLSFDDFALKLVVTTPGIDGSLSVCQTGSPVDLGTVVTITSTDGSWNFGLNPTAVNAAGVFNPAIIPSGVHQFFYITDGCAPDTTIATITVLRTSSAGNDGTIVVCRNQPLNLLQGLGGNIDAGGVWTNPNSAVVPNGNTNASNIPGQYNFSYIVTNGVCPADTANVIVTVQGSCDYLGLEDVVFEAFNMYPNPTSDLVFITNSGSTEVFNYQVMDMNGRVILRANDAINGSTTTELDLSKVKVGFYLIRVFNESADKTFRLIKK
jgi:hypothetical protein